MHDDADRPDDGEARSARRLGPVVVTTPSFGEFSPAPWEAARTENLDLRRSLRAGPLDSSCLRDELRGMRGVIVGVDRMDREAIEAAAQLVVIGKHGTGVDNIDLEAARERGIRVVATPGANASAVADMAVALLLAGARRIVDADASLRRGEWRRFPGPGLETRRVGLLGFGRIGQAVAKRMTGFGCSVLAHDPFLPSEVFTRLGVRECTFDEVIAESDFVSLHLPHSAGDSPRIDADTLGRMRAGAALINTARGGLVDDDALVAALESGHLAFAALDAFEDEPLPADSILRRAPHTILTPHAAAFTDTANAAMGVAVVEDVARVLRGEEPLSAVI